MMTSGGLAFLTSSHMHHCFLPGKRRKKKRENLENKTKASGKWFSLIHVRSLWWKIVNAVFKSEKKLKVSMASHLTNTVVG